MTRRETIIELARTLRDVTPAAIQPSNRRGQNTSFSLETSRLYRAGSYHQLEQALAHMLNQRHQKAVQGCSLGRLHWHFTERYIRSQRKALPARTRGSHIEILWDGQWQPAHPNKGHREPCGHIYDDGKGHRVVMVETWHLDVRSDRVELALDWLEHYMPARIHLPDWDKLSERMVA